MTDIPQTAAPAETLDSAIVRLSAAVFDAAAEVATLRERNAALEKALGELLKTCKIAEVGGTAVSHARALLAKSEG